MPEATWNFNIADRLKTAAATVSAGELQAEADGRAGVNTSGAAYATGDVARMKQAGHFSVAKTSGVVILDGGRVYWDHSANSATFRKNNDRDFYIGRAVGDAASADTEMDVDLNVGELEGYTLLLGRDPFRTVPVGTQALGGFLPPQQVGGCWKLKLSTTNEAQKVDLLSKDGFATGANAVVEFEFEVVDDGAGSAPDASLGIANDTHTTDADSITDSVFIHLDGNSTTIRAESDDGTTEVNATDTLTTYTAGTRVYVWFDMRNPADVQIYVNGSLVLPATVFNVSASVATWKLLFHLEKTSAADIYELDVDFAGVRLAEQ